MIYLSRNSNRTPDLVRCDDENEVVNKATNSARE
jgi:hypothetical protein